MRKYIVLLFTAATLLTSCSLKEEMHSYATPETYYQNEVQCLAGLNACYQPLRSIYTSKDYFQVTEVQTDIIFSKRKDQYNAILQVTPASPQFGSSMWKNMYLGVMRSNAVYAGIQRSPINAEVKKPLFAEAVVLRAMFYYMLTANFGNVPFYEEEVTSANNLAISKLPRMSAVETRDSLIKELRHWIIEEKALDMLPTNSAVNTQQYRAGAALGLYLAGKMCLWNERWTDAIEYFGYLEDIYGNGAGNPEGALDKYPLSDIPFSKRHTPEVILEVSNIAEDYGLKLYGNIASFTTPIRADSATEGEEGEDPETSEVLPNDIYAGIRIPELGQFARTHVPLRPCRRFFKKLMTWNSSDCRRTQYEITATKPETNPGEIIPIEDSGGYLAWGWPSYAKDDDKEEGARLYRLFSDVGGRTYRPYLGNKFWCFGMQNTQDVNSYKAFRFAGAILGLAEAWFQKGDKQKACDYLNAVKSRAGIPIVSPADFSSDEALLMEIQDEYARELFGEFQRKHDLVRWGIWYEMVMAYNVAPPYGDDKENGGEDNTLLGANIKPCHEYYPIPDEQITYSGGALDNKEYNKYGL